jgi:hypothetical protein
MRTGSRRRMVRAAWALQTRLPKTLVRRRRNDTRPLSQEKKRLKMKSGRKKTMEKIGGKGGGASLSSPVRVQEPKSDIETQCGEVRCRPSLLGVWYACASPKGHVIAL